MNIWAIWRLRLLCFINRFNKKRIKRLFAGILLCCLVYLVYLLVVATSFNNDCKDYLIRRDNAKVIISPPQLSSEDLSKIAKISNDSRNGSDSILLSQIVRDQIEKIQQKDCNSQPNFMCGHFEVRCGFGCNIHHRAACLMMSYVLNMPLIHTPNDTGWTFSTGFHDIFLPLGSACLPGPNTYTWTWEPRFSWNNYKKCTNSRENNLRHENLPEILFPLKNGLFADAELVAAVKKVTKEPLLWWIGQFVNYTARLNPTYQGILRKYREQIIGVNEPIAGAHIRRTDKIKEQKLTHELQEYFEAAEELFVKEEASRGLKLRRRIFIASDDAQVLPQARARWPLWEVRGFQANVTLRSPQERVHALGDVVRDFEILSSCNFIICGLSSNVCRLLLEIIHSGPLPALLKSLDGKHTYVLSGGWSHAIQSISKAYFNSTIANANYTNAK